MPSLPPDLVPAAAACIGMRRELDSLLRAQMKNPGPDMTMALALLRRWETWFGQKRHDKPQTVREFGRELAVTWWSNELQVLKMLDREQGQMLKNLLDSLRKAVDEKPSMTAAQVLPQGVALRQQRVVEIPEDTDDEGERFEKAVQKAAEERLAAEKAKRAEEKAARKAKQQTKIKSPDQGFHEFDDLLTEGEWPDTDDSEESEPPPPPPPPAPKPKPEPKPKPKAKAEAKAAPAPKPKPKPKPEKTERQRQAEAKAKSAAEAKAKAKAKAKSKAEASAEAKKKAEEEKAAQQAELNEEEWQQREEEAKKKKEEEERKKKEDFEKRGELPKDKTADFAAKIKIAAAIFEANQNSKII